MKFMTEIWTNIIYPFLSFIVLGLIYFTMKNLLPTYFSEKGKNIATKEDIGDITSSVESVKQEFRKETEAFKSQLQLNSNIQVDLITEERNAIIESNECFSNWFHHLIDSNLGGSEKVESYHLTDYRQRINLSYQKFLLAESRFCLFIQDEELKESLNGLKTSTNEMLGTVLIRYTYSLEKLNQERLTLRNIKPGDSLARLNQINEKEEKLANEATQSISLGLKQIIPIHKSFQNLCNSHLRKLFKNI